MPSSTVRYKALFVGDFNAKNTSWWSGDKLTTSINGHELKCLADDFNLAQLCELPTHVGHSGKPDSLLDLAFSSDSSMVASVDTLQPVSDHLPILLKTNAFGRPGADNQYAEQNEERWEFRNAKLEALHRTLLSVNWEEILDVEEDINRLWKKWKSAFFRCMEQTISKRKPRTNKPQTNPWFNSFLAGMIRRRNRPFRCACRSNLEENVGTL